MVKLFRPEGPNKKSVLLNDIPPREGRGGMMGRGRRGNGWEGKEGRGGGVIW